MALVESLHNDWYVSDAPDDVEVLTVLTEDTAGNPADSEDCGDLSDYIGATFPILGDEERQWLMSWGGADGTSQHSYTIVASDGTVAWRLASGANTSVNELTAALEDVQ